MIHNPLIIDRYARRMFLQSFGGEDETNRNIKKF